MLSIRGGMICAKLATEIALIEGFVFVELGFLVFVHAETTMCLVTPWAGFHDHGCPWEILQASFRNIIEE